MPGKLTIDQPARSAVSVRVNSGQDLNYLIGSPPANSVAGLFYWDCGPQLNVGPYLLHPVFHGKVFRVPQLNSIEEVSIYPNPFCNPYCVLVFDNKPNPRLGSNGIEIWINPRIERVAYSQARTPWADADVYLDPDFTPWVITPSLRNGGFETAGAPFADWAAFAAGASTVTRDIVTVGAGVASCRFTVDPVGSIALISQVVLVVGRRYRISFSVLSSINAIVTVNAGADLYLNITGSTRFSYKELEFSASGTILSLFTSTANALVNIDNVLLEDITDLQANFLVLPENKPLTQKLPPDYYYFRAYCFLPMQSSRGDPLYVDFSLFGYNNPFADHAGGFEVSAVGINLSCLFFGY